MKLFIRKENSLYTLPDTPNFENSIEFVSIDETILQRLTEYLKHLKKNTGQLYVHNSLKSKKVSKYSAIEKLVERIQNDLVSDIDNIAREFKGEPLDFTYYMGTELIYSDSVEIVKKVFHKERNDIGSLFSSLVVMYHGGYFYYWEW